MDIALQERLHLALATQRRAYEAERMPRYEVRRDRLQRLLKMTQRHAEALAHINRGDRPLALYWLGRDSAAREHVMRETHAGGVTINDCLWHFGQEEQPIGGVGASGMGAYHGECGFRTCSKEKPIFIQSRFAGTKLFQPPYGATFKRLLSLLKKVV